VRPILDRTQEVAGSSPASSISIRAGSRRKAAPQAGRVASDVDFNELGRGPWELVAVASGGKEGTVSSGRGRSAPVSRRVA
jgi:hypothetical protein